MIVLTDRELAVKRIRIKLRAARRDFNERQAARQLRRENKEKRRKVRARAGLTSRDSA